MVALFPAERFFPISNRGYAAQENLIAGRSTALLRYVPHGIWRVGRGAVIGVIFFIGHQWLLGAPTKEKCEHRNENYERNLHTLFLPMHKIESSGKRQVATAASREGRDSIAAPQAGLYFSGINDDRREAPRFPIFKSVAGAGLRMKFQNHDNFSDAVRASRGAGGCGLD